MPQRAVFPSKPFMDVYRPEKNSASSNHIRISKLSDNKHACEGSTWDHRKLGHHPVPHFHTSNGPSISISFTGRRPVRWSMLEQGLQSYIFGHVMYEFGELTHAAEVLGLSDYELLNVLHVLEMQKRHPMNIDQLYSYCTRLGDVSNAFIDPDVLKQYMFYFEFASNFEAATKQQRALAYLYLKQCNIKGHFVNALIQTQDDLWTGHSQTLVPIHCSHDRGILRELVTSPYFPSGVRRALFAKPRGDLISSEAWILYPNTPPLVDESSANSKIAQSAILDIEALPQYVVKSLRKLRMRFLENKVSCSHGSRDAIDVLLLHVIVTAMAQVRFLRCKLDKLPITDTERHAIFVVARTRLEERLLADFKTSIIQQLKTDVPNLLLENWDTILGLVSDCSCGSCDSKQREDNQVERDLLQNARPNLRLVIKDNDGRSRAVRQSRSRSQSNAPFHTYQNATEYLASTRVPIVASPVPPDYSPLNSDEESSESEIPLPNTRISNALPDFPVELQRRYTPWKSNHRIMKSTGDPARDSQSSKLPSSAVRSALVPPETLSIRNERYSSTPTSGYPPLPANINEAATLTDSLPSKFSGRSLNLDQNKMRQSGEPLKLKIKALLQTEKDRSTSVNSSRATSCQSGILLPTPTAAVATLNGMADATGIKRTRAPRKDKGQKRTVYEKRNLKSDSQITGSEFQESGA